MLILGLFASLQISFAQGRKISGKVTDASDGSGVPGASVTIKGTTKGAATDGNGNYSIDVRGASDVLVISFVGYKTTEVTVGSQTVIDVSIMSDAASLEELVVTGYSVDKRRESTGAISTVKTKDITNVLSSNVEQQLQGRVSGLTVITNGQAGTASQIRIRGFGAFGGNEPLYIVDGMPVGNTNFLNPDDIESTTVLKDASAASIYGARAANGVIVYTTKKGKKGAGKLNVTYDGMYGVTTPGKGQAMMNPTDYMEWTWKARQNSGITVPHPQFGSGSTPVMPDYLKVGDRSGVVGTLDMAAEKAKYNIDASQGPLYQVIRANKEGTDWYAAITRNAPIQRHTLGFSGGGEGSRYYVGLSAMDQKGILYNNSLTRYALRVNSEFDVLKNLRIGENMQVTYRQNLGLTGGNGGQGSSADENDFLFAFRMPSIIPIYDEFGGYAGTTALGFNNPANPVARLDRSLNNRNYDGIGTGNLYAELDVIPGLTLRSSIGGNYSSGYGWGYNPGSYENLEGKTTNFGYNENANFVFGWTFTNTASYKKALGSSNLELLVGQEALNTGAGRNMSASGQNPFSTDTDYITITTLDIKNPPSSSLFKGVNFNSYFGRAIYTLKDKYIFTGVIRRDGSSRFGENSRYGIFPAVSAAWRISSEPFMKNLIWVQDVKIRGGYGTMGNSNNVEPTNQYTLYGTSVSNSGYDISGSNNSIVNGFRQTRIGNPDAKWETSVTKNLGIDGSFLKGKLDVIFDLWQKDTKDLLYQLPITAVAGAATPPSVNIGKMVNKGIDIQIINRGKLAQDMGYELNVTGSFLDNKITYIAEGQTYLNTINPAYRSVTPIRNQLNHSLSSFFGYQVVGLFQSKEEIAAAPTQDGAGVGRFRYADLNGDKKIDADDRTYLGSPVAKFTGGVNFSVNYKGFDIGAYVYTALGGKIFNVSKRFTDFYPLFAGAAISERVKDSWSPTNTDAVIPIFENNDGFSTGNQSSSFYVEDGSYLRLQNISLGYNLPKSMLQKAKLSRVRLYANANNLFTLTKYQGLDPQVGGNADTTFGVDLGNAPMTSSFTFGVNLGF